MIYFPICFYSGRWWLMMIYFPALAALQAPSRGPGRMSVIAWESTKGVWKRTHLRGRSQRHSTRRVQAAGKSRPLENPISGIKCCSMFQIYYLWAHVIVGYTLHACLDFLLHVIYLGISSEPFRVVQINSGRDVLQSSGFCLACKHTNVRRPFDPANPIQKKIDPLKTHLFSRSFVRFCCVHGHQDHQFPPHGHCQVERRIFSGTPNLALCVKSDLAKWPGTTASGSEWGHSGPWFQEKRIGSGKDLPKIIRNSCLLPSFRPICHLNWDTNPPWEVMLCLLPFRSSQKNQNPSGRRRWKKWRILECTWRHEGNCNGCPPILQGYGKNRWKSPSNDGCFFDVPWMFQFLMFHSDVKN